MKKKRTTNQSRDNTKSLIQKDTSSLLQFIKVFTLITGSVVGVGLAAVTCIDLLKKNHIYQEAQMHLPLETLWEQSIGEGSGGWWAYPSTDLILDRNFIYCFSSTDQKVYKIAQGDGSIVWVSASSCKQSPQIDSWTNRLENLMVGRTHQPDFFYGGGLSFVDNKEHIEEDNEQENAEKKNSNKKMIDQNMTQQEISNKKLILKSRAALLKEQKSNALIVLSPQGTLSLLDTDTGVTKNRIDLNETCRNQPLLHKNTLIIDNYRGDLLFFTLSGMAKDITKDVVKDITKEVTKEVVKDFSLSLKKIIPSQGETTSSWIHPVSKNNIAPFATTNTLLVLKENEISLYNLSGELMHTFSCYEGGKTTDILNKKVVFDQDQPKQMIQIDAYVLAFFPKHGLFCWNIETKQLLWWRPLEAWKIVLQNIHHKKSLEILVQESRDAKNGLALYNAITGEEVWFQETENFEHIFVSGGHCYCIKDYRFFIFETTKGAPVDIYALKHMVASAKIHFSANKLRLITYNKEGTVSYYHIPLCV